MPATVATNRAEDLLDGLDGLGPSCVKSLRNIKNQIIGNRTKKLAFIKLGAVPRVASVLAAVISSSSATTNASFVDSVDLVVQSAATLGSFACGVDAGVQAVLNTDALHHLVAILSSPCEKVVDAGARSLKLIYHSKLAPKYNFLDAEKMGFLLRLFTSENENVTGLAASIISHSCESRDDQNALFDAGILDTLLKLLSGSINQRDASLGALAAIFRHNSELVIKLGNLKDYRPFRPIVELTKDRHPRTRLLACVCLMAISQASPSHPLEFENKNELMVILVELMQESGGPGDEAPFVLAKLVADKESLQKMAFDTNVVEKLCTFLQQVPLSEKRLQGLLLALAELCSTLEYCRTQFLQLQALDLVSDALVHDSEGVRIASCAFLKRLTRSLKSLSAGCFSEKKIVAPLVQLLHDQSKTVQVAALGAISNIVVDFRPNKTMFLQCEAVKELVNCTKSIDPTLRSNGMWALRNMIFLSDKLCKDNILFELTATTLASLVCDAEPSVQEQALGFVRNLVDGCLGSVDYIFAEDNLILNAVSRQVWSSSRTEVLIQGMYALCNIASGCELHKKLVMRHLLCSPSGDDTPPIILKYLQSSENQLRIASVGCVANLTCSGGSDAASLVDRLRTAGVITQIKLMVNDSCFDVKFRVRTVLEQCVTDASC